MVRKHIPTNVVKEVLIEAGYRCANPACRTIIVLDLHHMEEVKEGGGNEAHNLIVLCPNCHALYTRKKIDQEAIYVWKGILVNLNNALDKESISNLLFLKKTEEQQLHVSGDGVLRFSHLIASGLASFKDAAYTLNGQRILAYEVALTDKGARVVDAWFSGKRQAMQDALMIDLPTI